MRRNLPTLVDPRNTVSKATNDQLGVPTMRDLMQRLDMVEKLMATFQRFMQAPPVSTGSVVDEFFELLPTINTTLSGIIFGSAVKGSVTTTSISSTVGTTVVSFNTPTVLLAGVQYLVFGSASMASNAPASGFITSLIRIDAGGTNQVGMMTGTASGERTLVASGSAIVTGAGSAINVAGRAKIDTGTGTVNDASCWAACVPIA